MSMRRWHKSGATHCGAWLHAARSFALRLVLAAAVAMTLAPLVAAVRGRSLRTDMPTIQTSAPIRIAVTLEAVATARTGATGRWRATVARTVSVGDRVLEGFTAGGADGTDLCDVGSVPGGEGAEGRVQWRIDATVEAADAGTVTLALAWQRSVVETATGTRSVLISDQRAVRLQPDDVHVLDLVQVDAGSSSACANVLVRVRAARAEPPVVTRAWLTYDLWLMYEGAGGEQASRHLELAGADDAPAAVEFPPLRWKLNRAWADRPSQAAVQVAVRGTVRGRCRPDGKVDVSLDTRRAVAVGDTGLMGSGRKEFALGPGDTVAVELPNPTARLSVPWAAITSSAQPWAPGVKGSAETVTVDLGEFFRGSRFRVLVNGRCQ
jgi:hypothetical protein